MDPPAVPSTMRIARVRSVDVFEQAGWATAVAQFAEDSKKSSGSGSPASLTPPASSPVPFALSVTQPPLILQSDAASRRTHDSRLSFAARLARTLEDVKRSLPSSKHSSQAPSPVPYTLQPVASTHYLIEKGGVSIWIEKENSRRDSEGQEEKETPPQPSSAFIFTARETLFIINICLAQFLSLAGLAQTFAPMVLLSDSFGVKNPGMMAWPTAAYSLTLGSCILPAGRLGDMYGHKRIVLIGWLWLAISSVVCGFSRYGGFEMLTGGRALQGIGPALLIPNGLAIFGRNFPIGVKRNLAISIFGGSGPLGVVSGAVFSSLLAQLLSWEWSFWIMGMLAFVISMVSYLVLPADNIRSSSGSNGEKAHFDHLGCITGVGGLVLINFALNQAPIVEWTVPYIGVTLGLGVVLMCLFVWIELVVATQPLIPLKGLKKDAGLTLACIAAGWGSHGIWSYYMFLLVEQVRHRTPLGACTGFWPVAPIGLAAALLVGPLLKRFRVAYLMSIAMLCFLLSCLFLAVAPGKQGYFPMTFLSVVIAPFGMNWSFPTGVILMSNAVHREHQGIAASLVATMVNYSISTGLGFAGSINRYVTPGHGILEGYRGAWYLGIGLAGFGFLISLYFIWQSRVRK